MKFELAVADHQVAELRQMLQTCQGSSSGAGPVPGRKLQDLQGTGSMQVNNRDLCMGDMAMLLDALVFGHEKKSSTRTCTLNSFSMSADAHHDKPPLPDLSAQQDHHIAKFIKRKIYSK